MIAKITTNGNEKYLDWFLYDQSLITSTTH